MNIKQKQIKEHWVYKNPKKERVNEIIEKFKISELEAKILESRDFSDEQIKELYFSTIADMHNPELMKDAPVAADRLVKAIKNGENVVNYSDYDTDGFGSAVVFRLGMEKLGLKVHTYTNHRDMGFGICLEGVKQILEKFGDVDLIITTDNGIVTKKEVTDYLKEKGVDLIITDHHLPDETLPDALAVVDIKRKDETYPFRDLCGCGVIFKLLLLVSYKLSISEKELYDLLDIVAVSTVGDVVSLTGENRILVKEGLARINRGDRPIWKYFRETFSTNFNPIVTVDSRTLGFSYVPAINACSRLYGTVNIPIKAFLETDEKEMEKGVKKMFGINEKRKLMTKEQTDAAMTDYITKESEREKETKAILVYGSQFHHGIVGIIAGRMKETFARPAFVLGMEESGEVYRGSARSIPSFPIKEVLDAIQEKTGCLEAYGGHALAGGLSVKAENIEIFEKALYEEAEKRISKEDLKKEIFVDVALSEEEITSQSLSYLQAMEPYGQGFVEPVLGIRNFIPQELFILGKESEHLKLRGENLDVIRWYGSHSFYEKGLEKMGSYHAIGNLEYSTYDQRLCLKAIGDIIGKE